MWLCVLHTSSAQVVSVECDGLQFGGDAFTQNQALLELVTDVALLDRTYVVVVVGSLVSFFMDCRRHILWKMVSGIYVSKHITPKHSINKVRHSINKVLTGYNNVLEMTA